MVRLTKVLARVPVIKFRKGGSGHPTGPATTGSCPAAGASPQVAAKQSSAGMSTSSIPDIDLPLKYQRRPLSQEEIDHINGGGIKDADIQSQTESSEKQKSAVALIKLPRDIFVESGKMKNEVINLSIVIKKVNK